MDYALKIRLLLDLYFFRLSVVALSFAHCHGRLSAVRQSLLRLLVAAACGMVIFATPAAAASRAVLLDGPGPWRDARWDLTVNQVGSLLKDAGYDISIVSPVDLSSPPPSDTLLAVPSLQTLPLSCYKFVIAFLNAGGNLLASGGEPFRAPLYPSANGGWSDQQTLVQASVAAKTVLDPATATLSSVFGVQQPVTRTLVTGPDGQAKAVDYQLQLLTSNYFLLTAPLSKPIFNPGQSATIVWTRGTPGQGMMFEWDENDGSRWIAKVALHSDWTKQVLLPADFRYYGGNANRANSVFDPTQANLLYFGVAINQGVYLGPVEFAVGPIGTGSSPAIELFTPPVLETLSPWYKQYEVQRAGYPVRMPIIRGRGMSLTADPDGRYRAVGDLLSPSATWYVANNGSIRVWLPWPELAEPDRSQVVTLLSAASNRLSLLNAGPKQIVSLPDEVITLGGRVRNSGVTVAISNLTWSISSADGSVVSQSTINLSIPASGTFTFPGTTVGPLPAGDYAVAAKLVVGNQEIDRVDSRLRVFDPTTTYQSDQRIVVANGSFSTTSGRRVFLQGVNYWPRYMVAVENARFNQSWFLPQNYDPDVVEADLTVLQSLNINLLSIQFHPYVGPEQGRSLIDFLDRCRNHGMWANIYIDAFVNGTPLSVLYSGSAQKINPSLSTIIQSALLPGNDRVFAFDLLWEPSLGGQTGRVLLDDVWRSWIVDQYGSFSNAEKSWAFTGPRDAQGQLSGPLDSQFANDGAWRVIVAAYRRFLDDFLGRAFGVLSRVIRAITPGTLLSFRNGLNAWSFGNNVVMGYDLGVGAAHMDFVSSEAYGMPAWPDGRIYGFASPYGRYRSGGKPVYWAESGVDIGVTGSALPFETANCDALMRMVNEDGSSAAAVWWSPGGWRPNTGDDYGILNPDGSPRPCASMLSQWGTTFQQSPPPVNSGTPVTLVVDRDADARGSYGLMLRWQNDYVQAKQAGRPVVLKDGGTGTDTSNMPLVQIGNVPYTGSGPLKYANGEFAGVRIQCPDLNVTVENGATVQVSAGETCQVTVTVVNTGSAAWLPSGQARGVALRTNVGDLRLSRTLGYMERTDLGPLQVTANGTSLDIRGRLNIQGVGWFGEVMRIGADTGTRTALDISLAPGAAGLTATSGTSGTVRAGYATASVNFGSTPYGTAVFSVIENNVVVSEAGVPASPPTTSARIFVDFRSHVAALPGRAVGGTIDVNTGVALVNMGTSAANVTYTLRDADGRSVSVGHGTLAVNAHVAKFIDQVTDIAADFILPGDFSTRIQFGSLELFSDQPVSVVALRLTTNQRGETLLTSTPIADMAKPLSMAPIYFPQIADGGGYVTTIVLLDTSNAIETGKLLLFDDNGLPLVVSSNGGSTGSSFNYSLQPGGIFIFQTDGSPASVHIGSVQLVPNSGNSVPVGAGVFSVSQQGALVSESGVPSSTPTTHARIFIDTSNGHNTGLAISSAGQAASVTLRAFQLDGSTAAGSSRGPAVLSANGHRAAFVDELIAGLPPNFTGVLDISATVPFAALTLRSLTNSRGDFLVTTFPIADFAQPAPSPVVFPQIADGGGYSTQFILISAAGASTTTLNFFDDAGTALPVGRK
jgi:hypothetical protein